MTTSLWVLIGLLVVLWVPLAVLLRRRSLFPVVPVVPLVALAAGVLLDRWIEWLGTITIGVLHLVPVAVILIGNRGEYFPPKSDDRDASP
jgi:hypothetical protein